VSFIEKQ
jgi:hypothetical protein